ncbi:MAG: hypothetical protein ACKE51_06465, partial [Methylococcaceae bacterium]
PGGIFIQGPIVNINNGGAPTAGAGSNPKQATPPRIASEADDATPGWKAESPAPVEVEVPVIGEDLDVVRKDKTTLSNIANNKLTNTRKMEVLVLTSAKNPVANVEVTVSFEDNSIQTKATDKEGVVKFENTPLGISGLATIEDEEDLIAKSFAANILAATKNKKIDLMLQYLQSAVDYSAIKSAYQENYGKDVGTDIKQAFSADEQTNVISFLLKQAKLVSPDDGQETTVGRVIS